MLAWNDHGIEMEITRLFINGAMLVQQTARYVQLQQSMLMVPFQCFLLLKVYRPGITWQAWPW